MRLITDHQMQRIRNGDKYALIRKLTERQVRAIRAAYGSPKADMRRVNAKGPTMMDLARRYGVAQSTIENIVRRKTWRHI